MDLVKEIYKVTAGFPKSEMYGLVNQIRRAAVAIPSNISEGKKRRTVKDYVQFLRIADGSAAELETQLLISKDLYTGLDFSKSLGLLEEIEKMLTVMIKKLETSSN